MAKKQYLVRESCEDFSVYDSYGSKDDFYESDDEYECDDVIRDDIYIEKVKPIQKQKQLSPKKWSGVVTKKPNVSHHIPSLLTLAYFAMSYDEKCKLPDSVHYLAVQK